MLEEILKGLAEFILNYAVQYPAVSTVLMAIGVLRLIMKPLMSFLNAFVLATPSTADDEFLKKIEESKWYPIVLYVLDWLGSIKTPTRVALEKKK